MVVHQAGLSAPGGGRPFQQTQVELSRGFDERNVACPRVDGADAVEHTNSTGTSRGSKRPTPSQHARILRALWQAAPMGKLATASRSSVIRATFARGGCDQDTREGVIDLLRTTRASAFSSTLN